jgi:hypothetical protein
MNQMLCAIGKGKTATTITAPLTTVPSGTPVLIQGTIKDMSPGKPNTPAVSDDDMSIWMDYLYGQNATLLNSPPAPKGVIIRLSAMAPNGNVIDIGTVTSDSGGMFKKMWTPEAEGEYTIYATFDGSNSYWGSYAQTALGIAKATSTASPSEPIQEVPDTVPYIIGATVAVILAIVLATVLILRKRP